jgi:hypothetical protein
MSMSYFVVCTFDLNNATRADYQNAYADLANIGLHKTVVSDQGKEVVAPTTMTMGTFNGVDAASVRDYVRDRVQAAFRARRFSSEVFVVVAGNWAWGAGTT